MKKISIRHYDQLTKDCIVRDNLCIKIYFSIPAKSIVKEVDNVFNLWLDIIPKEQLVHVVPTPNSNKIKPKKVNDDTFAYLKENIYPFKKDIYIHIYGNERTCPDYSFRVKVRDSKINYIEMVFPTDFLDQYGKTEFIDFTKKVANSIRFDSCYAGLAINKAEFGYGDWDYEKAYGLASQELENNYFLSLIDDHPYFNLGEKCLNPSWINMYRGKILRQIGGKEKFNELSNNKIIVHHEKEYTFCQLGQTPIEDISLYQELATVVKDNLYLDNRYYNQIFSYFPDGSLQFRDKRTDKWLYRFLE